MRHGTPPRAGKAAALEREAAAARADGLEVHVAKRSLERAPPCLQEFLALHLEVCERPHLARLLAALERAPRLVVQLPHRDVQRHLARRLLPESH